jgi:hypothetical protein
MFCQAVDARHPGVRLLGWRRRVTLSGGGEVTETILASDSGLHRFQYGLEPLPAPLTYHRATIDVIEDPAGSLVVYSVDVRPDEMAAPLGQTYGSALACLRDVIEAD